MQFWNSFYELHFFNIQSCIAECICWYVFLVFWLNDDSDNDFVLSGSELLPEPMVAKITQIIAPLEKSITVYIFHLCDTL